MSVRPTRLLILAVLMLALPAVLVSVQQPAAQAPKTYKARLSTVPIDVTMQAVISGSGSVTAVLTGKVLSVTGTFEGLRSAATTAHIHRGPKGIRGPSVFDLTVAKATSGTITGRIELTPSQVADLADGRLYVQLHSEKAPDGNLWGWLLQEKR